MSSDNNGRSGGRGRGRSRGRGRGRGRGRSGGRGPQPSDEPPANFAGRGPKDFGSRRGASFSAGAGPRHHGGKERSRPDRIIPKLPLDSDDSDDGESGGVNQAILRDLYDASDGTCKPAPPSDEEIDHVEPAPHSTTSGGQHHAHCIICYTTKLHLRRTITPCGHDDICWACHLQLRYLHSDKKCPVCKTTNETLIVDRDSPDVLEIDPNDGSTVHHKRFEQYQLWGNDLGGGYVYRDDVGMHFPKSEYEQNVVPLLGYACGMPGCSFSNSGASYVNERDKDNKNAKAGDNGGAGRTQKKRLTGIKALKTHLRTEHGYTLCDLCVENKRDFVSKLQRYTPQGLKEHQSKGDGDGSGFTGHPLCEFCKPLRFYDIVKLHEHLNKEHYKCHICDKLGKPNQFFKDYGRLERHFDREHYLCHHPQCIAARFVVFENEIDLRAHEASVHGTSRRDGGTKIQLEFRVRRDGENFDHVGSQSVPGTEDFQFGLNGEAFVPDALPGEERGDGERRQENEPVITHSLHARRTAELRAEAARVRAREGLSAGGAGGDRGNASESFPTLGTESSATASLVGWTSDGARVAGLTRTPVGQVTSEEFPSLGPGPSAARAKQRVRMMGLGGGTRTSAQAAARPAAAMNPGRSFLALAANSGPTPSASSAPPAAYGRAAPSAPSMSSNNFPSLGGGPSRPGSGGGGNPYAAAQAHARKLKVGTASGSAPPPSASAFPALSSGSDFPAPPAAPSRKKNTVKSALAPRQQAPPPRADNMLHFPPPGAAGKPTPQELRKGMDTVESLKLTLGKAGFKRLKSSTKDLASGSVQPEAYVETAASLFENGLDDGDFWSYVPLLVKDLPNRAASEKTLGHMERIRLERQMRGAGIREERKKPINFILPKPKDKGAWKK